MNEGIIRAVEEGMLFAVRLILCALVAAAPVPSVWVGLGLDDASAAEDASTPVAAKVAQAGGHVVGSPVEDDDHEDSGEEEAALDADDHRVPTERPHGVAFHASDERAPQYPTDRPPRRPLV